jgi:hypothetical protein
VCGAGIETELGCHSFRATGIMVYLQNGGLKPMQEVRRFLRVNGDGEDRPLVLFQDLEPSSPIGA